MRSLREHRAAKGLSIKGLADAAGVAQRTVHYAETGRQIPRPANMWKIADALGTVPMDVAEFVRAMTDRPAARPDRAGEGER